MQHQTCEQEHTADPHVLFQHLGVDFYRRTSDKACLFRGSFAFPSCCPMVLPGQWVTTEPASKAFRCPSASPTEVGRLREKLQDFGPKAQLFGTMMIFCWSKCLFGPHTVDCAFEGLPCALCLEAVLDHPMRPGFANFWRSSFHSQSHCPDELS